MNKQIIHDERCIARIAARQAYDLLWPNRCETCKGWGGQWYSFDPSPAGSRAPSLGPGSMQDFDTCECINRGDCPRCGQKLAGPMWRPVNLREQASRRLYGLAAALQHARPIDPLIRAAWWRAAALFRENPTLATWAIYHPVDKLWERLSDQYNRPTKAARAVFAVQAWLERGVYHERPCYHCGWHWTRNAGDARFDGDSSAGSPCSRRRKRRLSSCWSRRRPSGRLWSTCRSMAGGDPPGWAGGRPVRDDGRRRPAASAAGAGHACRVAGSQRRSRDAELAVSDRPFLCLHSFPKG